jgi:hypothetical protein
MIDTVNFVSSDEIQQQQLSDENPLWLLMVTLHGEAGILD